MSLKRAFETLNYPEPDTRTPSLTEAQTRDVRLFATLSPIITGGLRAPQTSGICIAELLRDDAQLTGLLAYGRCLFTPTSADGTRAAWPKLGAELAALLSSGMGLQ